MLLKELEEEVTYLYHPDHLGSVSVVSNQRGLPYERVEYLPFGEVWIEETDPATGYIPFRFTSKELDEETGLYYHGARYYEPTISRWMSADPAGFALSNPNRSGYSIIEAANWYSYVSNNPVIYVDPTGGEMMKSDATRQSDDRWSGSFLGGVETYDDAGKTVSNTIGRYGCLFVAGLSVARSFADSTYRRFMSPAARKASLELAGLVASVNKEKYFEISKNSRGGKDVFLSVEGGIKDMIKSLAGVDVSTSRIYGDEAALKELARIDKDYSESYIIAEFKTEKGGSHFLPIQGVKEGPYGSVRGFHYTESYSGFKQGQFGIKDLLSIIVIKERTEIDEGTGEK